MTTTTLAAGDDQATAKHGARRPRSNQPRHTSVIEDLDAKRFWQLDNHSVRCLQPGDLLARGGELHTVVDVRRVQRTGEKIVEFHDLPSMSVTDSRWDDVDVTIYRPRAGF